MVEFRRAASSRMVHLYARRWECKRSLESLHFRMVCTANDDLHSSVLCLPLGFRGIQLHLVSALLNVVFSASASLGCSPAEALFQSANDTRSQLLALFL